MCVCVKGPRKSNFAENGCRYLKADGTIVQQQNLVPNILGSANGRTVFGKNFVQQQNLSPQCFGAQLMEELYLAKKNWKTDTQGGWGQGGARNELGIA